MALCCCGQRERLLGGGRSPCRTRRTGLPSLFVAATPRTQYACKAAIFYHRALFLLSLVQIQAWRGAGQSVQEQPTAPPRGLPHAHALKPHFAPSSLLQHCNKACIKRQRPSVKATMFRFSPSPERPRAVVEVENAATMSRLPSLQVSHPTPHKSLTHAYALGCTQSAPIVIIVGIFPPLRFRR